MQNRSGGEDRAERRNQCEERPRTKIHGETGTQSARSGGDDRNGGTNSHDGNRGAELLVANPVEEVESISGSPGDKGE